MNVKKNRKVGHPTHQSRPLVGIRMRLDSSFGDVEGHFSKEEMGTREGEQTVYATQREGFIVTKNKI